MYIKCYKRSLVPYLVVCVGEIADHCGQYMVLNGGGEETLMLMAQHGNVGNLLHQFSTHHRFCGTEEQSERKIILTFNKDTDT